MTEQQLAAMRQALHALEYSRPAQVGQSDAQYEMECVHHRQATKDLRTAIEAETAQLQEPSPGGVLFAVEEAIRNGDCPFAIEIAFDEYEAERKTLAGITGETK